MSTKTSTTVYSQISGRLVITDPDGGEKELILPISALTASFTLNAPPVATVTIPVGKAAGDDNDVIKAKDLADEIKHFKKVDCYLTIGGEYAPGIKWPSSEFKAFSGYVTGAGLTRTANSVGVVINATHWLIDLAASCAISSQFAATAPVCLMAKAFDEATGGGVGPVVGDKDVMSASGGLWKKSLKPVFKTAAESGSVLTTTVLCGSSANPEAPVDDTAKLDNSTALIRLEDGTDDVFDVEDLIDSPDIVFREQLQEPILQTLSLYITQEIASGALGKTTIWDKLLEFAGTFSFSVVPTISSATCAPISPCLAGEDPPRHTTILADEYSSFSQGYGIFKVWRGLGLISSADSNTNLNREVIEGKEPHLLWNAGCYLVDEDEDLPEDFKKRAKHGIFNFAPLPPYLNNSVAIGILGGVGAIPTNNPKNNNANGDPTIAPQASGTDEKKEYDYEQALTLGYNYAKWLYWVEHFRHRTGELTGKLRFDIAPGSVIRLEDIDGRTSKEGADASYLYAFVNSVQFSVDATSNQAATSFSLSHIRRYGERLYGTQSHPTYSSKWVGTVLQKLDFDGSGETFLPQPGVHEKDITDG